MRNLFMLVNNLTIFMWYRINDRTLWTTKIIYRPFRLSMNLLNMNFESTDFWNIIHWYREIIFVLLNVIYGPLEMFFVPLDMIHGPLEMFFVLLNIIHEVLEMILVPLKTIHGPLKFIHGPLNITLIGNLVHLWL